MTKNNNHESKSKSFDYQKHGNEISGQFLDGIVEHDAKVTKSEMGICQNIKIIPSQAAQIPSAAIPLITAASLVLWWMISMNIMVIRADISTTHSM